MPPPIPARSRSRQRLIQHQDAAGALAHIRALQQETISKNRQKDRALLVLENPKESRNQASDDAPMTTMSQFIPSASQNVRPQSLSRSREPISPLKLVPDLLVKAEPTDRESIEKRTDKKLHRMIAGLPESNAAPPTPFTDSPDSDNAFESRSANITKVVYVERPPLPPPPPASPKKKFLGLNLNIPGFRSSIPITEEPQILRSPEDFVGSTKAAEILGPTELHSRRSRSKSRRLAAWMDRTSSRPAKRPQSLPLGPASNSMVNISSSNSRKQQSVPVQGNTQPSKFFGADINSNSNSSNARRQRRANIRTFSDPKSLPQADCASLHSSFLRSQSLKYFDGNESPPPTPPAKNTPPKVQVIEQGKSESANSGGNVALDKGNDRGSSIVSGHGRSSSDSVPFDNARIQRGPSDHSLCADNQTNHGSIDNLDITPMKSAQDDSRRGRSELAVPPLKPLFYSPSVYSVTCTADAADHTGDRHKFPPPRFALSSSPAPQIDTGSHYTLKRSGDSHSLSPTKVRFSDIGTGSPETHIIAIHAEETPSKIGIVSKKSESRLPNPCLSPPRMTTLTSLRSTLASLTPEIEDWSARMDSPGGMTSWVPLHPSALPTPLYGSDEGISKKSERSSTTPEFAHFNTRSGSSNSMSLQAPEGNAEGITERYQGEISSPWDVLPAETAYASDEISATIELKTSAGEYSTTSAVSIAESESGDSLFKQQDASINVLNRKIGDVRKQLAILRSDSTNQKEDMNALQKVLNQLLEQVQLSLVTRFDELARRHVDMTREDILLKAEVLALKARVRALESALRESHERESRQQEEKLKQSHGNPTHFQPHLLDRSTGVGFGRTVPTLEDISSPLPLLHSEFVARSKEERLGYCEERGRRRLQANAIGIHPAQRQGEDRFVMDRYMCIPSDAGSGVPRGCSSADQSFQ